MFYIDNYACFACLCRGSAKEADHRRVVRAIGKLVERYSLQVWWEWLESAANIADEPSRYITESKASERQRIREKMFSLGLREERPGPFKGY